MGLYLRKSVAVGPFRFNLSNSGAGVSVGVRGLRVGTGPRGNYVRMGRGGVYYQQTFHMPAQPAPRPPEPRLLPLSSGTHAPLQAIESADATQIVDSSSEQLLNEIREKSRVMRLRPAVIVATILLMVVLAAAESAAVEWLVLAAGIAGAFVAKRRDDVRKSVVILYDFTPETEGAFQHFAQWCEAVASCRRAWHVTAAGQVYDRKYHAGASQLIQRSPTSIRMAAPPDVCTNVQVLSIAAGRQTLYFLPDRLLVYGPHGIGAVSYGTLRITASRERFIEDSTLPSDATVVDHTWRYVNKNGGPDRRFNNNPTLPICLYTELSLTTPSGLHEVLQISRTDLGDGFADAIRRLAAAQRSDA